MADARLGCPATPEPRLHVHGAGPIWALSSTTRRLAFVVVPSPSSPSPVFPPPVHQCILDPLENHVAPTQRSTLLPQVIRPGDERNKYTVRILIFAEAPLELDYRGRLAPLENPKRSTQYVRLFALSLPLSKWRGADRSLDRCSLPRGPTPPDRSTRFADSPIRPSPAPASSAAASPSPLPGKNYLPRSLRCFRFFFFYPRGSFISPQISARIRVRAVLPSALQRGGRPSSHLSPVVLSLSSMPSSCEKMQLFSWLNNDRCMMRYLGKMEKMVDAEEMASFGGNCGVSRCRFPLFPIVLPTVDDKESYFRKLG
ncbi:hypothetical protein BHE74_00012718 [Ensete ventricosum]|nr:hypothetical protein BHE74_00012718 [Ensete ventricosum]